MLMALALPGMHPASVRAQPGAGLPAATPPLAAASTGSVILPPAALQPSRPVRHLSVDEALTLALEQNLDLRVERINPLIQDTVVADSLSVYAPTLSTTVVGDDRDSPAANIFAGGEVRVTDRFLQDSVDVVQQVPWMGAQYSARWNGTRTSTTNIFSTFNPVLRSNLSLNYTQPLLRNFGIDGFRQQIAVTRANRDLSDIQLRRTVVQTERTVRNAYWQLVFAQSFLAVQRQSLELAEESLRNNRTRVEVGTMAPIDMFAAEAEVARNTESVILAEADVERAEDRLRTLILDPDTPEFWSIRLQPSDSPVLQAREIDVEAAVRYALLNRTDLDTVDKNLEVTDTNIRYYRNQQLPDVNLQVDYGLTGLGGERLIRSGGFPGMVVGREQKSFGSVLGDIFANDFPNLTVGVTVSYPLGTSSADANLERSRLERSQSEASRRSLELRIATEVRDAARSVRTNLQRVEATRASRELAERSLEAEQRKFEVGLSTNFLVFQAQRDLATARNSEQSAILDYIRSLVDFDAVQEVPLGGVIP
jgi:outer membrane protein TolC